MLEEYLKKDYMIWIDTCSIMHKLFEKCIANYSDVLKNNGAVILIPSSVKNELIKHTRADDKELKQAAEMSLDFLEKLIESNYLRIYDASDREFADNDFIAIFTQLRIKHNLLLITQDKDIAYDIWALGKAKSVFAKNVSVAKITSAGKIETFFINKNNDSSISRNDSNKKNKSVVNKDNDIVGIYNNDITGDFYGDIIGTVIGDIKGDMYGDIIGELRGDIEGDLNGDIIGSMNGNIGNNLNGDILGIINGDIGNALNGDIIGILNGVIKGQFNGEYNS